MISETHPAASWFLLLLASSFLVIFALPLFLMPLRWAKVFRWRLPADTDLTVYFGRCLGGVAVAICIVALRAVPHPQAWLIDLIIATGALLTVVHVWGAVRKTQPWTENAEIGLYAMLTVLAVWVRSGF